VGGDKGRNEEVRGRCCEGGVGLDIVLTLVTNQVH